MIIIGHRGASGYAPENTIASFKKSIDMGSDGIELDIQLTKDKKIVVIHDYTLKRTTSGDGQVRNTNFNELISLDAGSWYNLNFESEHIPTLESVFASIPKEILINIEIKKESHYEEGIEAELLSIIKKYDRMDNVVISSFNHSSLQKLRALDSKIRIGVLADASMIDLFNYIDNLNINVYSLHLAHKFIDKRLVDKAKKKGYKIYAYTVNDRENAELMNEINIDGIITDYPDVLKKN